MPIEHLNPKMTRRMISTERLTVAKLELKKGAIVPEHSHHNEQFSIIESGALKFIFGDKEVVVRAGEVMLIPPDEPHAAEAVEDMTGIDIFTPPREDWIRGDDAYLRRT